MAVISGLFASAFFQLTELYFSVATFPPLLFLIALDGEISCHAIYAGYLETDRQVAGGLQGVFYRCQDLHARLLTIDQGGRVDSDGEALLGYFQFCRDVGYQDRDNQQVVAAHETEARGMLRARTAFDIDTQQDLSRPRIAFGDVAGISLYVVAFRTVLDLRRYLLIRFGRDDLLFK